MIITILLALIMEPNIKPIQEDLPVHSLREQRAFDGNDVASTIPDIPRQQDYTPPEQPQSDQSWMPAQYSQQTDVSDPGGSTSQSSDGGEIAALRAEVAQLSAAVAAMTDKPAPATPGKADDEPISPSTVDIDPELYFPTSPDTDPLAYEADVVAPVEAIGGVELTPSEEREARIESRADFNDATAHSPHTKVGGEGGVNKEKASGELTWAEMKDSKEGRDVETDATSDAGMPVAINREGIIRIVGFSEGISIWTMVNTIGDLASDGQYLCLYIAFTAEGEPDYATDLGGGWDVKTLDLNDYGGMVTKTGDEQSALHIPIALKMAGGSWAAVTEGGIYDLMKFNTSGYGCVYLPIRLI